MTIELVILRALGRAAIPLTTWDLAAEAAALPGEVETALDALRRDGTVEADDVAGSPDLGVCRRWRMVG